MFLIHVLLVYMEMSLKRLLTVYQAICTARVDIAFCDIVLLELIKAIQSRLKQN